jgi:hypothetical protein
MKMSARCQRLIIKIYKDKFIYYNRTLTHTLCWNWAHIEIIISGVFTSTHHTSAVIGTEDQYLVNKGRLSWFKLSINHRKTNMVPGPLT